MHRILTVLALASLVLGCQHGTTTVVPQVSRTGHVHNVKIGLNEVSPPEMTAGVGDEVLFFNERTQPVHVILIEGGRSIVPGTGGYRRSGIRAAWSDINPGESASFCFEKAGMAKYMVRSKPHGMVGGEKVVSAEIQIREASAEPVETKDNMKPSPSGTELSRTPKE